MIKKTLSIAALTLSLAFSARADLGDSKEKSTQQWSQPKDVGPLSWYFVDQRRESVGLEKLEIYLGRARGLSGAEADPRQPPLVEIRPGKVTTSTRAGNGTGHQLARTNPLP